MEGRRKDQGLGGRSGAGRLGIFLSGVARLLAWSDLTQLGVSWSSSVRLGRRGGWLVVLLLISLTAVSAPRILSDSLGASKGEDGAAVAERIAAWQRLIDIAKDLEGEVEKLHNVNAFFNKLKFVDDRRLWGAEDYWATPLEFLTKNGGDCEDFAIAKYFTLLAAGVPEERLRLTYVKALDINQSHMVLTYYATPRDTPLVLDNLNPLILPATERQDLQPVYSFNGSGLWLAKSIGTGKRIDRGDRLDPWRELLARMPAISTKPGAGDAGTGK